MNEITLSVEKENLETLLTILNNLKSGLISEIKTDSKTKVRVTQYQPKSKKVIYEQESGTNDSHGKYASVSAYKQRLKSKKQ